MPELPEVETTVRGLAPVLEGHRIARIETRRSDLRRPLPDDLGQRLTGARVTKLWRRAKYGLIDTDRGDTLIFHLGMSGHWRVDPQTDAKHDHVLIETDEGRRLALNDPRRFGSVDLLRTDSVSDWGSIKALGPEPLDLGARELQRRLRGRKGAIKLLLLDQKIVAGLGNIYVCEALHRAGIHPLRSGGRIGLARLEKLVLSIQEVLLEAIAAGGSSLRDFVAPGGELGYFPKSFAVYGREGAPCACGGTVRRIVQGSRSTFYCPKCQS